LHAYARELPFKNSKNRTVPNFAIIVIEAIYLVTEAFSIPRNFYFLRDYHKIFAKPKVFLLNLE
jgi:hypothetical protein